MTNTNTNTKRLYVVHTACLETIEHFHKENKRLPVLAILTPKEYHGTSEEYWTDAESSIVRSTAQLKEFNFYCSPAMLNKAKEYFKVDLSKKDKFLNSRTIRNNEKRLIREHLLDFRLQNYGYDCVSFNQLKNRKAYITRKLKKTHWSTLDFSGLNRWYISKNDGCIYYCTGQSENEEMITWIEALLNLKIT